MHGLTRTIVSVFLLGLSAACAASFDFPDPIYGRSPPDSERNWIALVDIGPSNHLGSPIWITPRKFPSGWRQELAELIVLPRSEYRVVVAFVEVNRCSTHVPENPGWGFTEVAMRSRGSERIVCRMPREVACTYLTNLARLPDVKWTEDGLHSIRILSMRLSEFTPSENCGTYLGRKQP
jgi:hypothetical protein